MSHTHSTVVGGLADDSLAGTDGLDRILGDGRTLSFAEHGGNDTLAGNGGADTIYGDAAQMFGASGGHDVIFGGGGGDLIYGDAATVTTPIIDPPPPGDVTLFPIFLSVLGSDTIMGGHGDDTIWGDSSVTYGPAVFGNDSLRGGSGNDVIHGDGAGSPFVGPPLAASSLVIRNADDTLIGGKGDDTLYGDGGNDVLRGGSGKDWLDGGLGADTITGGAGADTFVVRTGDNGDVFTDFRSHVDRILIITIIPPGSATHAVHTEATADGLLVSYGGAEDTILLQGVTSIDAGDIWFG